MWSQRAKQDIHGLIVLVVDDDEDVRSITADILAQHGAVALEASGASHAIALLNTMSRRPDVFVLDVVMPELDGPLLAPRLTERAPDAQMVFMSGYVRDANVRDWLCRADVNFLPKPFTPSELVQIVAHAADGGASLARSA